MAQKPRKMTAGETALAAVMDGPDEVCLDRARIEICLDDGDHDTLYEQDATALLDVEAVAELADDAALTGDEFDRARTDLARLTVSVTGVEFYL